MGDSKTTPGPWETGQAHWNEDGDVMYTLHGIKEAKVADARLIAAAPDLLEALKASNEKLRALLFVDDGHPLVRANLAAIAKAEGRP